MAANRIFLKGKWPAPVIIAVNFQLFGERGRHLAIPLGILLLAAPCSLLTAYCSLQFFQDVDLRQGALLLAAVQAVAHQEPLGHRESHVV